MTEDAVNRVWRGRSDEGPEEPRPPLRPDGRVWGSADGGAHEPRPDYFAYRYGPETMDEIIRELLTGRL